MFGYEVDWNDRQQVISIADKLYRDYGVRQVVIANPPGVGGFRLASAESASINLTKYGGELVHTTH